MNVLASDAYCESHHLISYSFERPDVGNKQWHNYRKAVRDASARGCRVDQNSFPIRTVGGCLGYRQMYTKLGSTVWAESDYAVACFIAEHERYRGNTTLPDKFRTIVVTPTMLEGFTADRRYAGTRFLQSVGVPRGVENKAHERTFCPFSVAIQGLKRSPESAAPV